MEQSPWEADSCSAGQEIPRLFGTWNFITVFTRSPPPPPPLSCSGGSGYFFLHPIY